MYTRVTCSQSLNVQGKYLSVKYFVQLSVSMAVYMSVPFCLLSMYNLYMYICIIMYVIHCWNRYTDMFYNCVIFVILNKRKRKK